MFTEGKVCYQRWTDRSKEGTHGINNAVHITQLLQDSWVHFREDLAIKRAYHQSFPISGLKQIYENQYINFKQYENMQSLET